MSSMGKKGVTAGYCNCCVGGAHAGVTASLDEMDFHRSLSGAAQAGDVGRMRGLLSRGAKVDGDGDYSGYAPLHYAARHGHSQACLLLLQSGAQVNRRTRAGQATSLHRAAYSGHIEVVKVLIQHGASVELQDSDGQTCLHKASMQGHTAVVKLLTDLCPRACEILDNRCVALEDVHQIRFLFEQSPFENFGRLSLTRGMEGIPKLPDLRFYNDVSPKLYSLSSSDRFLRLLSRGHLQRSRNEQIQLTTRKDPLSIMYAINFMANFLERSGRPPCQPQMLHYLSGCLFGNAEPF